MKKVKFAILGCGKIGPRHAEKLKNVEGAELVAVCDIIPERSDELSKKYSCRSYHRIEDLLEDNEVDFVNICTPSGLHPGHTIKALKAGRHVLCEKPMAFSEKDALRMIATAKEEGKMLFVVKQNRYNPPVKLVTNLLKEGKLGKPIKCIVNMIWNRNEDYYKNDAWRGTIDLDGGTIYTQASHFVDLMLSFFGEPKSLSAFLTRKKQPIETEDTGVIAVEFKNGAVGAFNYTTCATNKNYEGSIVIIGTKGTVKIGGEYLNEIDYFQVEGMDSYKLEPTKNKGNDYGSYKGSMSNHNLVFKAIVEKLNGKEVDGNLVSGRTALMSVRFMEKAIKSSKNGKRIDF